MRRGILAIIITSAVVASAAAQDAEKLIKDSDCSSCHALDRQVVGPAYAAIAKSHAGQTDAVEKLATKIRDGGNGMTPHPDLTEGQRTAMAKWILSQTASATAAGDSDTKTYPYKLKDGTTVNLDFPLFLEGQGPKVTKEVFHGYQLYNSYCYRCHGTDASGSQLAPDLRHSLAVGMKQRDFLSIAMAGKKEQGMPAWAGFLSEDDVVHIFRYVKGRSLDLVSSGRPPSAQD
ncbi:MAG TPA: c-type cytochrome [Bryobacteraceae bacterium]|nr:c-type cytochrome [Bryobacteraceae bacterium]